MADETTPPSDASEQETPSTDETASDAGTPGAPPEPASESESVPTGTAAVVLTWVDGDAVKARRALDAEQASSSPRKGLVKDLTEIVTPAPAPVIPSDPSDPLVGKVVLFQGEPVIGSEQVSFEHGEYRVDPASGVILGRL